MCGRFTLTRVDEVPDFFEISDTRITPRFNVAPTQEAPIVRRQPGSDRRLDHLIWGLIPPLPEAGEGSRLINARSETAHEKPSFRRAFRERRCLVPTDGFYEWKSSGSQKQPYHFSLKNQTLFAFAGLWEVSSSKGRKVESFTILTCPANEIVSPYHDRMPVVLPRDKYGDWLAQDTHLDDLLHLMHSFPSSNLVTRRVNPIVNNVHNDRPECLEPPPAQQGEFSF